MDTDTVVVASVVCEAKQVDLQISESPCLCGDIGLWPGKPFPELRDMLDVPDLWSFVDAGLAGPSPASRDMLDLPISVGVVDSGPGPPVPKFGDKWRLPDFHSDIEAVYWHGRLSSVPLRRDPGGICRSPEAYRVSFADDFPTGSGKPFP